ncbi:MAG: CHAD domain-containing protein [Dehalococcoidia bacterium]|nr:CHAD domain-containing protein [Dehalococcoidia bacterium]
MAQATDILEVEWQFAALDVRPVLRWLESANVPGYTITPAKVREFADTYYDTPDWRVHRAKYTGRLRRKGESAELTMKAMAEATDGMRSRRELTEPVDLDTTPLAADGPCGKALRALTGRRELRPLFTLEQVRRPFVLADAQGEIGEIAVDDTVIPVGAEDAPVRLARVEVEVHPDAVERSKRFVDLLVVTCGLTPAGTAKFEAALLATGMKPGRPEKNLGSADVSASMTAGEVAFAVMRKHFGVFLANEPGTRLGDDIEFLHDMRVAARRLRAAMQAFRPFLPPRIERFRQELGWVAAALGEVRDLDVQVERMAEWRAGFSESEAAALDSIEALFEARRQAARRRMLIALDSRRYDLLVERFSTVLQRGAPNAFAAGRLPILAVAPDLLEKRYRRLRKLGDRITPASPAELYHELRIDGKKLRYALEFVGPIYGRPAVEFSQRVTALQDVLGLHQDAEVAITALAEMAAANWRRLPPASLLAMGAISERYRVHAEELRRQFPPVYKPLGGQEWKRLRKLIESQRVEAVPIPIRRPPARMAPQHR